ncbi:protein kinase [Nocardioides sp.]|uniref:protein kinase domain-containing protein n=1 Tax=Nocardioides sp. TaxID=35761 RepID=UPI003528AB99
MSARGYPQPGEEIGGYRVDRRIGDGGMGVVLAATQRDLDRRVALKVIAPQWADDPSSARGSSEARALAALDSPHVVHVYTYGEEVADDGSSVLYLATQLIEGGDLARVVRERGCRSGRWRSTWSRRSRSASWTPTRPGWSIAT